MTTPNDADVQKRIVYSSSALNLRFKYLTDADKA